MSARAPFVAAAFVLAACSNGQPNPSAGAGSDAAAEVASTMGMTCQQIRLCVFSTPCADEACVASCAANGSPAAQATFEALRACTEKTCDPSQINCACTEQCLANGTCLQEADACLGTAKVDDICDELCA